MGPYLSAPKSSKTTTTGENSRMSFAASEMQGWRISMEDAKLTNINLDDNTQLFGVFDGHGGKEVAIFVERHFCQELSRNSNYQQGNIDAGLTETFIRMDELLQTPSGQKELLRIMRDLPESEEIQSNESDSYAGCTSVVAVVRGSQLVVANAGDSRCVLAKAGSAVEMTIDHKPDMPSERERIVHAGGSVEDGRVMGNLNLSRSLGDLEYKRNPSLPPAQQMITAVPEIRKHSLEADCDFMILACDGIWDVLNSQECVDFIYARIDRMSLSDVVEAVLDRCLAPDVSSMGGLGCDNMTCIIVKFKHPLS